MTNSFANLYLFHLISNQQQSTTIKNANNNIQGYERMNLCDALESKRFGDGQQIILQGDQANGMYFIESGVRRESSTKQTTVLSHNCPNNNNSTQTITIIITNVSMQSLFDHYPNQRVKIVKQMDDGRTVDVAILGKGDYFGELALINHKPRAASACAGK